MATFNAEKIATRIKKLFFFFFSDCIWFPHKRGKNIQAGTLDKMQVLS